MLHTLLNSSYLSALLSVSSLNETSLVFSVTYVELFHFIRNALDQIKVLSYVKFATDGKEIQLPSLLATAVAMPVMYCL